MNFIANQERVCIDALYFNENHREIGSPNQDGPESADE